jgi:hypothetical protein
MKCPLLLVANVLALAGTPPDRHISNVSGREPTSCRSERPQYPGPLSPQTDAVRLELRSPTRLESGEKGTLRIALVNCTHRRLEIVTGASPELVISKLDGEIVWRAPPEVRSTVGYVRTLLPMKSFEFLVPWDVSDGAHPLAPGEYVLRASLSKEIPPLREQIHVHPRS